MKNILMVVFCLFFTTIFGQAWVPIGSVWVYEREIIVPIVSTENVLIECVDTVEIGGKMCSKLKISDPGCSLVSDSIQYLFAENQQVFIKKGNEFRLLYDFSTPLFGSWKISFDAILPNDSCRIFVVGVDTFTYNNVKKRIFLIQIDNPNYYFGSYILEDIGSAAFLLPQFGACEPQTMGLKCFYHPVFGNYGTTDCLISSNYLSAKKPDFNISPNPSNGRYFIDNQQVMANSCVEIYDFWGNKIASFSNQEAGFWIDLTAEASGVYFVKSTSPSGDFSIKKLVKI